VRAAQQSISDGKRAIQKGDCGEAVRSLAHAYEMVGMAEGYARAMRKVKGRADVTPKVAWDKRLADLGRLRVKVANSCEVK